MSYQWELEITNPELDKLINNNAKCIVDASNENEARNKAKKECAIELKDNTKYKNIADITPSVWSKENASCKKI